MDCTIWKFGFDIADEFAIEMPGGAEILDVQEQHGLACIWALIDPEASKKCRYFRLVGTGHPFDYDARIYKYMGTFQMHGGNLVFHLFENIMK